MLALDDSLGGDGIVAHEDIRSIADLEGRMVGVDAGGTVSEFYLNVLLKEAGLSQDDIEVVALSAEDAGNAFVLGDIDVAVTWEPWLSLARAAEHGHLLADSSDHPGLIVDVLTSSPSVLEERLPDFKAFARAWAAAVAYVEAHPEEANRIMAKNVGGWLEDPAVFAETLEGHPLLRCRAKPGILRHPGPPRPDLRDRTVRHRHLVEPRRARRRTLRQPT